MKPLWKGTNEEKTFREWLDQKRPDVVVAYGNPHYRWLLATGRRIPEDIGYVLLSNFPRSPGDPQFAALEHNFTDVGAAGVRLLHTFCTTQSCGSPRIRTAVVVDATWICGETARGVNRQPSVM